MAWVPRVDRVLLNARIYTFDARFQVAEAVAIRNGRVVAVGSTGEIRALAEAGTQIEDLAGAVVLPGLIDAHTHLLSTSLALREVQLYDCRSIPEILDRVRERAAQTPPGQWIVGRGWDEALLAERRHPTRWELDRAAPDHPVVLQRVWNKLVANSAALAAAGVTRTTPDPPADARYAGGFERDSETGEPTGLFWDRAKELILDAIPEPSETQLADALQHGCRAYNAVGLVGVAEPGLDEPGIRAYQRLRDDGLLTVRADLLLGAWGYVPTEREPELKRWIGGMPVYSGFGDDLLRLGGVKLLLDGGVGDRTARFYEPYLDEPDNLGQWVVDPEEYPSLVRWVHELGWSIDTHTCGTAAQDLAVRAYVEAQAAAPNPRLRHRVHHAYFPSQEAVRLMAGHRIPALVSTPFLLYLGDSFIASLGPERVARAMPMATYLAAGVPLAGTSDSPITDFNPFVGIYAAITRRTALGHELDPSERISREAALRSYTIGGAYALGQEAVWGSIEPGKLADLIVADRNPLAVDEQSLKETRVLRTMLGGVWVYEAGSA